MPASPRGRLRARGDEHRTPSLAQGATGNTDPPRDSGRASDGEQVLAVPSSEWEPRPVPCAGSGRTPANEDGRCGARAVFARRIGLRITHSKQSKLYLLPPEPEILTAKRDLW